MTKQDCTNCAHAMWKRTQANRMHPSGDGRCTWKMPEIKIPACMFFNMSRDGLKPPAPSGGYIDRKRPHTGCPTWQAITEGD